MIFKKQLWVVLLADLCFWFSGLGWYMGLMLALGRKDVDFVTDQASG